MEAMRHQTGDPSLDKALFGAVEAAVSEEARATMPTLEAFSTEDLRVSAANSLGEMGTHAKPYVSRLRSQLDKETSDRVKFALESAIEDIEIAAMRPPPILGTSCWATTARSVFPGTLRIPSLR